MPTGNLPEKAREVFLKAEASAKKTCPKGDRHEECVARKAWAAVKRGWKKEGDKWVPKATAEFSLYINKASFDKTTQEMRWYAVASDIEPDSYNDEMSLELYADFLHRIETEELPPERHRSDYWSGGKPYLSISHYLDLNGEAVPGPTDNVFVDGKCLKANGRFNNTVLGKACFDAICKDLYGEEKSENENKVRISIAFIDWGHIHKSNDYEFIRESLDEFCPECLKELIMGEGKGKVFKKGHLIHLALTRVPVNERTSMEVRSMTTTRKDDAASIVGEELAEEIAEKAKEELKADLVIKSEQEEEPEVIVEESKHEKKEDEEDEEEDKKKKEKEMKSEVVEEIVPHVLDSAFESFRSAYDEVLVMNSLNYTEKLQAIQGAYEKLGEAVKSSFAPTPQEKEQEALSEIKSLLEQVLGRQDTFDQKLALLEQKSLTSNPKETVPSSVRRSIQFDPTQTWNPAQKAAPLSVKEIVRRNAGLSPRMGD